jgi:uncharacterized circularly permuted ATP-grasp superfamily protein/uncharacterized alpha-E superfamily protein
MAAPHQTADPFALLLADYPRPTAVPDEMISPDGSVRPVWQPMLSHLSALDADAIGRRFARANQYLRDEGVFYRGYEDEGPAERDWPLSHIPVILAEAEWEKIAAGIRQRAELLEMVAADLYGPMKLVTTGLLPPDLIAQNPAWLRPLVGVRPRQGFFLNFLAFEIGRGPDEEWFVLGDRTEAPAGMGFALENRVATLQAFPDFRHEQVHRLAGFFRSFREALTALGPRDSGPVAILTPGPMAESYFEHAYIARYLGMMLLEGEDLVVENGQALVRTVTGPQPISLLWRRMDASYTDPLELDEHSQIGTPGLVGALRSGSLSVVNALGAGVLQTRALMAFLPRIARSLLGEALALPNIATWWCGQARERTYVRDHAEKMTIGPALSLDLPFEPDVETAIGGQTPPAFGGDVNAWIAAEAGRLVGQEAVTLSTTPAWRDGRLVPRPLMLRVFAGRTSAGWEVMPGGYARIGKTTDVTALSLRRGGAVSDVWIHSDAPVRQDSLAPPEGEVRRATVGVLPSRAADNLHWLGRYAERAEHLIRLLRAYHSRLGEAGAEGGPLVTYLKAYLADLGVQAEAPIPESIGTALSSAVRCAEKVRDRFSPDGWSALRALQQELAGLATLAPGDGTARALGQLLRGTAGFNGLVHDNMYRFTGWRFLSIGRALERGFGMTGLVRAFAPWEAPGGSFDVAVEVGDSVIAHRRRYLIQTNRNTVIDLLVLDPRNPRSIRFQVQALQRLVAELPETEVMGSLSALARAVLKVDTALAIAYPPDIDDAALADCAADLAHISELLTKRYLT